MLVLGLRAHERVYLGPACVLQLEWFSADELALRVWEGGREAAHTLAMHEWVGVAGGRVMFAKAKPGDNNVKLAFDVPRSVRIKRHGMLTAVERRAICSAAGLTGGTERDGTH